MGKTCAVKSCTSGRKKKTSGTQQSISFYQPRTSARMDIWKKSLGIDLKANDFICHLHFQEKHLKMYEKIYFKHDVKLYPTERRMLREEAVPTIEHQYIPAIVEEHQLGVINESQIPFPISDYLEIKHDHQEQENTEQQELFLEHQVFKKVKDEQIIPQFQETQASAQSIDDVTNNIKHIPILPPYWFYIEKFNELEFMRIDLATKKIKNHIRLNEELSIIVVFPNKDELLLDDKINSVCDIYNYLKSVEKWPLCVGTQLNDRYSKMCKGVIIGNEAYKINLPNPRCKACRVLRSRLLQNKSTLTKIPLKEAENLLELCIRQSKTISNEYIEKMQSSPFKMSPISIQLDATRAPKVEPEFIDVNHTDSDKKSCKDNEDLKMYEPDYLDEYYITETPISNETSEDLKLANEEQANEEQANEKQANEKQATKKQATKKQATKKTDTKKQANRKRASRKPNLKTQKQAENEDDACFNQTKMFKNPVSVKKFEEQFDCKVSLFKTKSEQIENYKSRKMKDCYINCKFRCESCFIGFNREDKYNRHLLLKHDETRNKHACDICSCYFRSEQALRTHRRLHCIAIRCRQCPFVSVNNLQAQAHFRLHRGFTYDCKFCDAKYQRSNQMFAHQKSAHPSRMVSCDRCGELFVSRNGVNYHKALVHSVEKEISDKLKDGEKPYECEMCDERFYNEQSRMVHVKRKHLSKEYNKRGRSNYKKSEDRSVVCDICGRVSRSPAMLAFHKTVHTGEKPFECDICHKRFRIELMLKRHEWRHTGVKGYTCDQCDTQCTSPWNLRKHVYNKHSGITRLKVSAIRSTKK